MLDGGVQLCSGVGCQKAVVEGDHRMMAVKDSNSSKNINRQSAKKQGMLRIARVGRSIRIAAVLIGCIHHNGVSGLMSVAVYGRASGSAVAAACRRRIPAARVWSSTDTEQGEVANVRGGVSESDRAVRSVVVRADCEFVRSRTDKRTYRYVRLEPSKLQCLLTSDPDTDVEAAAINVRVGHLSDPPRRPGLAHFQEHMLFLGTDKYPAENDMEQFLGSHGGSSNAYTDMEDTNYYFSVPFAATAPIGHTSLALAGGLDRFAQFFVSPAFSTHMIQRELHAIHSEYLNSMTSDSWRNFQLLKLACNPLHPFSKFGCGNYFTLTNNRDIGNNHDICNNADHFHGGTSPRPDLIQFWNQHYHAQNMRLVVTGRASLDALQHTVEDTFQNVRPRASAPFITLDTTPAASSPLTTTAKTANDNIPSLSSPVDINTTFVEKSGSPYIFGKEYASGITAFGPSQLGKIREVIPVVETRTIKLYFATPSFEDPMLKHFKPFAVLSHLLGHESRGSLHALLLDAGFLNDLSTGVGIDTSDFSLCTITLTLTPKGMAHRDHILSLVWQWIQLIRSVVSNDQQLMEKHHDEVCAVAKMNFDYCENGDPADFCSAAAELLFRYDPSQILIGGAMPGPYNSQVTQALLDRFTPENCFITIYDPDLKEENDDDVNGDSSSQVSARGSPWKTEQWYHANYREADIPVALQNHWSNPTEIDPRLKLPDLNSFVPKDFSLRCEDPPDSVAINNMDHGTKTPKLLLQTSGLRLWHKLDRTYRIPKTFLYLHITSPNVYRSPRTMTYNRLFLKVLADDLNSMVYDASVAGCNYRVSSVPNGYRISLSGYSDKLSSLLHVVTSRIFTLLSEWKSGEDAALAQTFQKARENLLRETKNFRLDPPHETANYMSRMMIEDRVWHVDHYIRELEGAEIDPLSMEECAKVVEECLSGNIMVDALCMGNIAEQEAKDIATLIEDRFLKHQFRPLQYEEIPKFRSYQLPTKTEAARIFGGDSKVSNAIPLILEEVAYSESEENNAVELTLQTAGEYELGYSGVAITELIGHIAYNSAYNQLRTKEQLGYITSAFMKKTAGSAQGLSVVVQSSTTLPAILEERCENWLTLFRSELEEMSAGSIAMEGSAVAAQLLERNMNLSEEVSSYWGEILSVCDCPGSKPEHPPFDRLQKLAAELRVIDDDDDEEDDDAPLMKKTAEELKQQLLDLFDKYFAANAPERRALSSRTYSTKNKREYEKNIGKPGVLSSYDDVQKVKQYLSLWPTTPYWI